MSSVDDTSAPFEFSDAPETDDFLSWLLFNADNMIPGVEGQGPVTTPPGFLDSQYASDDMFMLASQDAVLGADASLSASNGVRGLSDLQQPVSTPSPHLPVPSPRPGSAGSPLESFPLQMSPDMGMYPMGMGGMLDMHGNPQPYEAPIPSLAAMLAPAPSPYGLPHPPLDLERIKQERHRALAYAAEQETGDGRRGLKRGASFARSEDDDDDGESDTNGDEHNVRDRDRNRELAKESRKKKRIHADELEARVAKMTEENDRLKLHLVNVHDKQKIIEAKKLQAEAEIEHKLTSGCEESELVRILAQFKDLYADYGVQRKNEVNFHLQQLEALIFPTQVTKMSLWTLEQDETFYRNRKKGTLSHLLTTELGVSEDQINRIQERRARIKLLIDNLRQSLKLVKQLQVLIETKHQKFDVKMAELQSIFTPTQVAKLILWVTQNQTALAKLVPGVIPRSFSSQRAASRPNSQGNLQSNTLGNAPSNMQSNVQSAAVHQHPDFQGPLPPTFTKRPT